MQCCLLLVERFFDQMEHSTLINIHWSIVSVHGVLWLNLGKLEKQEKFRGAKSAFIKLRKGTPLSPADREVVCRMVDEFTTVSLCPAEVGPDVVQKVKDVNTHHHTKKACRKENRPGCR